MMYDTLQSPLSINVGRYLGSKSSSVGGKGGVIDQANVVLAGTMPSNGSREGRGSGVVRSLADL